jgi:hypothetical protein
MGVQGAEECLVEFEAGGELALDLADAVEELVEDRRGLFEMGGGTAGELLLDRGEEGGSSSFRRCRWLWDRVVIVEGAVWVGGGRGGGKELVGGEMAASIEELVAKGEEVFLDEDLEAFKGTVKGIEAELGKGGELGGSIPAVGAVNEDVRGVDVDVSDDDVGAW